MCVKNGAKTIEFVQTKPSSGRKGDRRRVPGNALARFWGSGVSGGRSPRNFGLAQILFMLNEPAPLFFHIKNAENLEIIY